MAFLNLMFTPFSLILQHDEYFFTGYQLPIPITYYALHNAEVLPRFCCFTGLT